jgi:hypothetical protein
MTGLEVFISYYIEILPVLTEKYLDFLEMLGGK